MSDDELVSIFAAQRAGEAEIVRLLLEGEGIAACVAEKRFAGLFGLLDFHVLVKRADEPRAKECLVDRSATGAQEVVMEDHDAASVEEENSEADGAETPALLRHFRLLLRLRRHRPSWLRWLIE